MPPTEKDQRVTLVLVVSGAGVKPSTVDSVRLLELGASYLELLQRIAGESDQTLTFRGLSIESGSVQLVVRTDQPDTARNAAREAGRYFSGRAIPSPGIEQSARRARHVLGRFNEERYKTMVHIRQWKRRLALAPLPDEKILLEQATFRAVPIRVGGATPMVRFNADTENGAFSLHVVGGPSAAQHLARRIGGLLYTELEIETLLERDQDGQIVGGTLENFQQVEQGDALAAWQEWYRASAAEWLTFEEAQRDLTRGGDVPTRPVD